MATSKTPDPAKTDSLKDAGGGKTKVEQGGESAPRLPHEHDQSSDSQRNQDGTAPRVGRQAFNDVERGVVDTDRGPEADRVYNDKVKR
ncbi:hypothetical protein QTH97_15265 [Variovorax sp. J22R24]|uniref:hypothetical protein n=1 Tax=Variovorax gracilis TaxID=3053502 RepID=UPI0025769E1E|nr:hypothetical protein [Variovorax sp. J22R24]MDM0106305.1 hypothetical protein [Variovorax sp. J22R24]